MKKGVIIVIVLVVLGVVAYLGFNSIDIIKDTQTSESGLNSVIGVGSDVVVEEFEGPGGCVGSACNEYCSQNSEDCDVWCQKNSDICEDVMASWGDDSIDYGEASLSDENDFRSIREGDGVWEKSELTFYIKDEEGVLSDGKRRIIQDVFLSKKESDGGYWGWNSALAELNRLYPDNAVPDGFVEIGSENDADFIIIVSAEKEFCCDYGGDPVKGRERSEIDSNSVKIKSRVWMYDVVKMEDGFFGDIFRHEVGHGIGIFGHVTNRNNDLMSIVSPASVIKKGNLDDLYIKYKDRIIESNEEASQRDIEVRDEKVRPY